MSTRNRMSQLACAVTLAAAWAVVAEAAELPDHRPLRVLIVSDAVNPHGLPPADLTEPGDLSVALRAPGNGLRLDPVPDGVLEVATNAVEVATAALSVPRGDPARYDVLIYFAHRIPDNGNDPQGRQDAFTAAVDAFLVAGGGVVAFHHGMYTATGKTGILDLIGATASGAVPWDTVTGQNVIATAPLHWATCQSVEYDGTTPYADPGRGVVAGDYAVFNNTPDERYPFLEYNASALGNVETLFSSDYNDNGTTHLLGWVHRRSAWRGRVVAYQPGEYQPAALDDLDGNNFQILANAIVVAAGLIPDDQVQLETAVGPGPDDVTLDWSACDGEFTVFAAPAASLVGAPQTAIDTVNGRTLTVPAPGGVTFFRVDRASR